MKLKIDIDELLPGSIIEQHQCEAVIGLKKTEDPLGFQFKLMQLAELICKMLWKKDKRWTVCTKGGEVHILTHEQASKYNQARFDGAMDKMRRCNKRLLAVDESTLSPEARIEYSAAVLRQSRIIQGLKQKSKPMFGFGGMD